MINKTIIVVHKEIEHNKKITILACGKDNILWHQSIFHDGELRQLNPLHASDCVISTSPVELYVVGCVAICRQSRRVSQK